MTKKIEQELAKIRKDVKGLIDLNGDLKDEVIDLKADNRSLTKKVNKTHTKGVSKSTLEKIKSLESMVQKLSDEQFLDRQYYNNTFTAALGLTKELRQTVAANDSH
jgi:cell division protein FtsI/penicillin-binding protein 2